MAVNAGACLRSAKVGINRVSCLRSDVIPDVSLYLRVKGGLFLVKSLKIKL
jgi:hypothetical protein